MNTIIILVFAVLSSIAYRCGGLDKTTPHWIPVWLRQSWVRDWLCPACILIPCLSLTGFAFNFSYISRYLLSYGLTGAALSTYFGFINPLFGKDKKDKYWWNWFISGFFVALPLIILPNILSFYQLGFFLRLILLPLLWTLWSIKCDNDFMEEYGRGALLVLTLFLF